MIRFKLWNVEFRIHILTILSMLLAYMLGTGREMVYIMLAVSAHEAAHIAAAKLCGAEIEYVDIMCFGGAARFRNLYAEGRLKLIAIAISGPAANLALAVIAASLAWWQLMDFYPASMIVRINLVLMIFNLMPALPLDGGRILYALIYKIVGKNLALHIGMAMGMLLSAVLVVIAAYGWFSSGVLNITLIILAVFIIASALKEKEALYGSDVEASMEAMLCNKSDSGFANVAVLPDSADISAAIGFFDRQRPTVFALSADGRVKEWITCDEMARRILSLK